MQDRYSRITGKKKTQSSREKSCAAMPAVRRGARAIDKKRLPPASLRLNRNLALLPSGMRKSVFNAEAGSLREEIWRRIETEALRIAQRQGSRGETVDKTAESANLRAINDAFCTRQSTLEWWEGLGQINELERQFLTHTIQAVSYVLGMDPVISKSLACVRRRAKEVAGILANAIGQSSPPPEAATSFPGLFPTV